MRKLSLSVLMPCLNPSENLDESISSCLKNVELDELVIADGMSGVETIEKLKNENGEISSGINNLKNQILYKRENEI